MWVVDIIYEGIVWLTIRIGFLAHIYLPATSTGPILQKNMVTQILAAIHRFEIGKSSNKIKKCDFWWIESEISAAFLDQKPRAVNHGSVWLKLSSIPKRWIGAKEQRNYVSNVMNVRKKNYPHNRQLHGTFIYNSNHPSVILFTKPDTPDATKMFKLSQQDSRAEQRSSFKEPWSVTTISGIKSIEKYIDKPDSVNTKFIKHFFLLFSSANWTTNFVIFKGRCPKSLLVKIVSWVSMCSFLTGAL